MAKTGEIRIYTGSGYEDFVTGQPVIGSHIFSQASTNILKDLNRSETRIVESIEIVQDGFVIVDFDSGESYEYRGLNYRHSGLY